MSTSKTQLIAIVPCCYGFTAKRTVQGSRGIQAVAARQTNGQKNAVGDCVPALQDTQEQVLQAHNSISLLFRFLTGPHCKRFFGVRTFWMV
jgi:hypothetical protein